MTDLNKNIEDLANVYGYHTVEKRNNFFVFENCEGRKFQVISSGSASLKMGARFKGKFVEIRKIQLLQYEKLIQKCTDYVFWKQMRRKN